MERTVVEATQVHETTAHVADGALAEVHVGSDMAIAVGVSCPSSCCLWGDNAGTAAHEDAFGKGNKHASLDGSSVHPALADVPAASDMTLKLKVSCPSNCSLQGGRVSIAADEGIVAENIELVSYDGAASETDVFVLKAPAKLGKHTWTAVCAAHERAGILHEEASAPFSFTVRPHSTSIAILEVPSPIAVGAAFKLKVGVKCSVECSMVGKRIEVCDHHGASVATGALGDVPWPSTDALFWSEVALEAPGIEGYYEWSAKFPKPDLELPHEGSHHTFGFVTTRPPEHVVTIEVSDRTKRTPIQNAQIVLLSGGPPYRSCTNDAGLARVSVPKGDYEIHVCMYDYRDFQTTAEVASDVVVKASLCFAPVE
jgi:hypothetical protein